MERCKLAQQSPATSPLARRALAMVFDAVRGELVMFGGQGVSSPPATVLVLLVMGFSADQFGTAPLPLELSSLGMPGCWLYSSMEVSDWLVASSGVATSTLTVPNSLGLLGLEVFAQAGAIDPPANAAGLTVSNGLKLRIGQ